MSAHVALRKMYEWRGKDFHPGLIEQFIQCMGIYPDLKPYPAAPVVDLMRCTTPDGQPCEIAQVLEPGDLGVDPVRYLTVPQVASA